MPVLEERMDKVFCLGLVFGMVGGALLVANSYKVRSFVKKSQAEVMQKVDEIIDEKMKEQGSETAKTTEKKKK